MSSRDQIYAALDRHAASSMRGIKAHRLRQELVKSYLFELDSIAVDRLQKAFEKPNAIEQVDDGLFTITQAGNPLGYLDVIGTRVVALYSVLPSLEANNRVLRLIRDLPLVDAAWFPGRFLTQLWEMWIEPLGPERYIRLKFDFSKISEVKKIPDRLTFVDDEEREDLTDSRRGAAVTLAARSGVVSQAWPDLRKAMHAFSDPTAIRLPAADAAGGHDLYSFGKLTNRSDSFLEHRDRIGQLTRAYEELVSSIEKLMPSEADFTSSLPVVFRFEPMELEELRVLAASLLNPDSPFRLWGELWEHGPSRLELRIVDLHNWQPLTLELGRDYMYLLCPSGSCGNVVNRLMTHVQRYIDANAICELGQTSYDELLARALGSVA